VDGVKWIKLSTELFNNRKIKQIEELPNGDSILVVWVKLLILAADVNDNGFIYLTKDIPYTEQTLATEFKRPLTLIQSALNIFVQFGMIEVVNDIIMVSNWKHYQNEATLSEIREHERLRKQQQRERQKLSLEEKESNKEKDIIIENKKENIDREKNRDMSRTSLGHKKNELDEMLDAYLIDGELREAFIDFIVMRKAKKRPLSPRALKMVINKLRELSNNETEQINIINQSILHNWDTVYALKNDYSRVGANGVRLAKEEDHTLDGIL